MDFAEANGVPETREEYDALKQQSLLDTAEASGKYIGSQNDIEAAITNMLATKPALQEFFAASTEAAEGVPLYKAQLSELADVISVLQCESRVKKGWKTTQKSRECKYVANKSYQALMRCLRQ